MIKQCKHYDSKKRLERTERVCWYLYPLQSAWTRSSKTWLLVLLWLVLPHCSVMIIIPLTDEPRPIALFKGSVHCCWFVDGDSEIGSEPQSFMLSITIFLLFATPSTLGFHGKKYILSSDIEATPNSRSPEQRQAQQRLLSLSSKNIMLQQDNWM